MDYKKVGILLAIGLLVLAGMIIVIGPDKILDALKTADMKYVALAIIIEFIILGLWNTRWSLICKSLNIQHNPLSLFAMTILGLTINNLTPSGRSGGEPVRAYLLSKNSDADFETTLATVMGDKLFDTFPFLVLAIFAISYLMFKLHLGASLFSLLLIALVVFIILLAFIIYICINESAGIRTIQWIFRQIRRFTDNFNKYEDKATDALIEFQYTLKFIMKDRKLLVIASLISFLVWFLELFRVYVIFLGFGVSISLGMIASVFLVSSLIGIIPILPGGLGSIDGVMILLYSMAGVSAGVSTAATLVERMISLWMIIIIGMILLPFFGTRALDYVDDG